MNVKEINYDDFDELLYDIAPTNISKAKYKNCIFRGEDSKKYKLLPTALREECNIPRPSIDMFYDPDFSKSIFAQILSEFTLLKKFYKYANNNGLKVPYSKLITETYLDDMGSDIIPMLYEKEWIREDLSELAALAQHYGVITRLLDWTQDFMVALYFASLGALKKLYKNELQDDEKIIIWALDANWTLPPTISGSIPLKLIIPPYSENPNLNAQKGVLSLWKIKLPSNFNNNNKKGLSIPILSVDRTPLDELLKSTHFGNNIDILYRIILPAKDCKLIFNYIDSQGYDAARLFPGFHGIARKISEDSLL